jgi:hypothetical protein
MFPFGAPLAMMTLEIRDVGSLRYYWVVGRGRHLLSRSGVV